MQEVNEKIKVYTKIFKYSVPSYDLAWLDKQEQAAAEKKKLQEEAEERRMQFLAEEKVRLEKRR